MVHEERAARLVEHLARADGGAAAAADTVRLVRAPGRVNLIGEHTDYNLGLVMPVAISLETWVASWPTDDDHVDLLSIDEGDRQAFDLVDIGPRRGNWIDYVCGVAWALDEAGVSLRGVRGVIDSTIPMGSGLSSSAALELAAAWTLSRDVPPPLAMMDLARAAQRAENSYVGVQS